MASLKDEITELKRELAEVKAHQEVPDPVLQTKGEFFGKVMAAAVGQMGSAAFGENFLKRLENNAERLWNAYVAITRGDSIMMAEERVKLAKESEDVANQKLRRALETIAAQNATIADLSQIPEEDDLPEEASVEDLKTEEPAN